MSKEEKSISVNNLPPVSSRRLDSLAWLLQGLDKCGAVAFDGDYILLATNNNNQSDVVIGFQNYLLNLCNTLGGLENLVSYYDKITIAINEEILKFQAVLKSAEVSKINKDQEKKNKHKLVKNLYMRDEDFKKAVNNSLNKVALSICATILIKHPALNTFKEEMMAKIIDTKIIEEIKNNKFKFIGDKGNIHAEMKIVQYLIDAGKITNANKEVYYIGISKKCCLHCECAITAINDVIGNSRSLINVRSEGHKIDCLGNSYDSPAFLKIGYSNSSLSDEILTKLKNKYEELVKFVKSKHESEKAEESKKSGGYDAPQKINKDYKKEAKQQLQDRSPSPPNIRNSIFDDIKEWLQTIEQYNKQNVTIVSGVTSSSTSSVTATTSVSSATSSSSVVPASGLLSIGKSSVDNYVKPTVKPSGFSYADIASGKVKSSSSSAATSAAVTSSSSLASSSYSSVSSGAASSRPTAITSNTSAASTSSASKTIGPSGGQAIKR